MMDNDYYDYLVLGGEHHGEVFIGLKTPVLTVVRKTQPLVTLYSREEPAEALIPLTVSYLVTEYTCPDGKKYFIASNDELLDYDINAEILTHHPRPVN